jgi:asparagine synthase (glutamine-hydrolysing)
VCGIAGILVSPGRSVDAAWLRRMNDVQRHRGPDAEGIHVEGRIGFANRRLAIVDRDGGAQPMRTSDGTVWITYNGEVFDHRPLRRELESLGARFRTVCDTEVVLNAYLAWGDACVERFNGQFAFAIWDGRTQRLLLARDRLGIHPLHHAFVDGALVFASEAKAILALADRPVAFDELAVAETLLCGSVFEGRTMFADVRSLEPGHTLALQDGRSVMRRFWDVPLEPSLPLDERDAHEALVPLLDDALAIRVPDEVPWGVLLSGGTDSSTLSTLAARRQDAPLSTFTIDFPNAWKREDVDATYAREVAETIGAKHRAFRIDPAGYFDVLERLIWHLERPFNKGAGSMFLLYEQVAKDVTVVVSGEGADELFAGYVGSRGLGLDAVLDTGRIDRLPWAPHPEVVASILAPEFRSAFPPEELVRERVRADLAGATGGDPLNRALYLYLKRFLLELLEIHDRTSLAFGVEGRFPYLDHRFVDRYFPIPVEWKVRDGQTKVLFRTAIDGLIPRSVLERAKSHMPIPRDPVTVRRQLELATELLLVDDARTAPYYDRERVAALVARDGDYADVDGVALWQITMHLITLEVHHRVFAG